MDLHRETVHVQDHRLFPSLLPWGLFPPFSPPAFDHLDPTARQLRHRLVQSTGRFSFRLSVSNSRDKVGCDASPVPSSKAAVPRRVWLATRKLGS